VAGRLQVEIVGVLAFACLLFIFSGCTRCEKATALNLYSTDSISSGDIILRKSYGMVSEVIVARLNDTVDVSHCGIIYRDAQGHFNVIHALSRKVSETDGMQICRLDDFLKDSRPETVRVVRYINDTTHGIIRQAIRYLDLKVPFDEDIDMADTTRFFCSELPIHIIKTLYHTDISDGAEKPKFSVFLNRQYFKEIPLMQKAN